MSSAVRGTPTLLGLPYDASSSFLKGTAAAPPLIRQALHSPAGNPWTETGVDLGADGALGDAGDVPLGTSAADARTKIEEAVRTLREAGYVSIDIDAFDPAFAPGVSHREPGGLTVREVLTVLHGLSVPLVAADIVEFNPAQDPSGMTATLCAKLVKEVAGKMT